MNLLLQCREANIPRILGIATFCLIAETIGFAAQAKLECVPEKTFAQVGHLLEKKQYEDAKASLRRLKTCTSLSPIQQFNVGWLYGKAQDFPAALQIFESVPLSVPDELTHTYAIALVHFEQGNYQAAISALAALRSKGICDEKCADLLGVAYSKIESYQDAYTVMAENLRQDPSNPNAYYNLINLFADTGELNKAAQVANKAIAALPRNAEAFSMRGFIELSQAKEEDAYSDFASASQLSPMAPDPPFFMALADYRQAKFADAVQVIRNAIASGIVDSDLHYLNAECLIRIDPMDSAYVLAELDRAIQLNPNSVSARVLRGQQLLQSGRPQDAIADLRIARELEPNPQRDVRNATYLLGRAYAAAGKQDEAKVLFDELSPHLSSDKAENLNHLSDQKMRAALHR
jgi:tetratricopeptide (TPR) repeat protein